MKRIAIFGALLLFCISCSCAFAQSLSGDVLWNGSPMKFLLILDGNRYGLKIYQNNDLVLRVSVDMGSGKLMVIDDLKRSYAQTESKQLVAMTALFAMGKIFGVDDDLLRSGKVNFFPLSDQKVFAPFGECIRLRVNNDVTGMYWVKNVGVDMNTILSPFLQELTHDGIRFPFWDELVTMKGFSIANQKDYPVAEVL
ncbi:MAG: hypothetical protein WCP87_03125, partial [Atribacterota bacterium]